jgi:hypothetical protein
MSLIDHLIIQPILDISHIWTSVITAEVKQTTTLSSVDYVGKYVFFMLVPYREFISPVMTSILMVFCC